MIMIINESELPNGKHLYRIQINRELICTFEHDRKDGLAECLQAAANAVRKWDQECVDMCIETREAYLLTKREHEAGA